MNVAVVKKMEPQVRNCHLYAFNTGIRKKLPFRRWESETQVLLNGNRVNETRAPMGWRMEAQMRGGYKEAK